MYGVERAGSDLQCIVQSIVVAVACCRCSCARTQHCDGGQHGGGGGKLFLVKCCKQLREKRGRSGIVGLLLRAVVEMERAQVGLGGGRRGGKGWVKEHLCQCSACALTAGQALVRLKAKGRSWLSSMRPSQDCTNWGAVVGGEAVATCWAMADMP